MKYITIITFFFLLFKAEISNAQVTSKDEVIRDMNNLFDYLYKNEMFNGAVGVRYNGEIIFKKGYGKANFETGTLFTPASQTEIASMSKQFTATAIMILWKDGKLQLTDDINKYFSPALPYKGITIEDLLTHQSGLPEYSGLMLKKWDHSKVATNEDIVNLIIKFHPAPLFDPGTKYKYSNLGYILLAQIVKKVSGEQLDQFLKEHVFLPFGMSSTGFYPRPSIFHMPLYAPGVVMDRKTGKYVRPDVLKSREYVWYLSGRYGSGRITTSVNDLFVWDSLLYTNAVLPQPLIKKMFVPRTPAGDTGISYGYGWFVEDADPSVVFHTGSWPGNLTYIKRYTKNRSTIIILNNTSSSYMKDIRNTVDEIMEGKKWTFPAKK